MRVRAREAAWTDGCMKTEERGEERSCERSDWTNGEDGGGGP